MAHVIILRETVSFVEGKDLVYGTHELIEQNINNRLYEYNRGRKGYNIPSGSEVKLITYRMKKECIPDFLKDLKVTNLNPKTLPKGFWKILIPKFIRNKIYPLDINESGRYEFALGTLISWITVFLKYFTPLKSIDVSPGVSDNPIKQGYWCYDYLLGIIEDIDRGMGEEL